MDARCRIELLGRLRVQQGDREITRFSTQKTAGLLGYLAYYTQRAHPREVLIEALWPGCAPAAGRHRLRLALSSLRHQLEPPDIPAGSIIKADRFSVQLSPAAVVTDVAEFEAAQRSAEQAGSDTERAECLAEAVELYGGELLPGYYQDWIIPEQRRLADLYFRAVRWLTGYLEQTGEWERALECARRAVGADPLREEGHQDLMRLLAAAGQPSEALRQYQELEHILREELDATPSAATSELARQIELRAESREFALPKQVSAPPSALPTGTVTFLLTDIEGGRLLLKRDPEAYQEALESHNALLRDTFRGHGGQEVKEAGSSFTVAFARPSDALTCALEGQQALAAHRWPEGVGQLLVRMAVHTTEVKPEKDEAPGWLLRRGTALLLAAHGGQILCSEPSAVLLRRSLEADVELVDLGYYRLRSTEEPEHLFAVKYPGMGPQAFSPPSAAPAYTSNLPIQLTAFFGREEELASLQVLMLEEERRLVTLTGPGGSGKTRLALETAAHVVEAFRGAVWFVELQRLSDAALIVDAVLDALSLARLPEAAPLDQAAEILSRQRSLLVLDNFEHLVEDGAPVVRTVLERIPTLTCLVTSRRRLDLTGEWELLVAPLPTPSGDESPEGLMQFASVELFVDRAQAVRPDFQVTEGNARAVAELCSRLEGIPLALELAAARAQVLTPTQMVAELEHRFEFLVSRKRDVEQRHRTLHAAMDWSYQLLSPQLQRLFTQLSVFRGGWTAESAAAVCEEPRALEYLQQLRECSLVLTEETADEGREMRFRMLDTLREYAQEQLPPEEQAAVGQRHADCYLVLAERAEPRLRGSEQAAWLDRLEREHNNLRAALEWCTSAEEGAEVGLRLAGALRRFWDRRGHLSEGRAHLTAALQREGTVRPTRARAKALSGAGALARSQGDYAAARSLYEESLAIRQELGDKPGIAASLNDLGIVSEREGDRAAARFLYEKTLEIRRELGDQRAIASSLNNLGIVAHDQGDWEKARSVWEQSLAIRRELGDKRDIARSLANLGTLAKDQGRYAAARSLYDESLAIRRELGDERGIARSLANLAALARDQAEYASARTFHEESLAIKRGLGDKRGIADSLQRLAALCRVQEQPERAARLFAAAGALREAIGVPLRPNKRDGYDRELDAVRSALGNEAFEAAWAAGRAMTLEEAVAFALEESQH